MEHDLTVTPTPRDIQQTYTRADNRADIRGIPYDDGTTGFDRLIQDYRAPDGVVSLKVFRDDRPGTDRQVEIGAVDLMQVRAEFYAPMLPRILEGLTFDARQSANTFFGTHRRVVRGTKGARVPIPGYPGATELVGNAPAWRRRTDFGLPYARCTSGDLRWLDRVHVDCDFHRLTPGVSLDEAFRRLVQLMMEGLLPPVSEVRYALEPPDRPASHGLWLTWWLLSEDNPAPGEERRLVRGAWHDAYTPERAHRTATARHERILQALMLRCRGLRPGSSTPDEAVNLGGDWQSAACHVPVHGTQRSVSDALMTTATFRHTDSGLVYAYTLGDFEGWLADSLTPLPPRRGRASGDTATLIVSEARRAACEKGGRACVLRRRALVRAIVENRGGGCAPGCRNRAMLYLATTMVYAGENQAAIYAALRSFVDESNRPERLYTHVNGAGAVSDPLTDADIASVLRGVVTRRQHGRLRLPTVARVLADLHVTDREQDVLRAQGVLKAQNVAAPADGPTQRATMTARRALIRDTIESLGHNPGARELAHTYLPPHGLTPSFRTVHEDLIALGLNNTRRGRPPADLFASS